MSTISPLCIAPMIQWSDRYWRYLMRQITQKTLLYTEMTMDSALKWNKSNLEPFLGHNKIEYPLALQLGGCDPKSMGEAAYLAESYGAYESINVNAGCPSNRAKKVGFGAELMLEPDLVRRIVYEMKRVVTHTDITVKCRLGVTNRESWDELMEFIHAVSEGGVRHVIVHARCCVLSGLSPAQNRTIPPLRHDDVHRLVEAFPEMKFTINGGIKTFQEAKEHLNWSNAEDGAKPPVEKCAMLYCANANKRTKLDGADTVAHTGSLIDAATVVKSSFVNTGKWENNAVHGVMIGREAYRNPWLFSTADREFFSPAIRSDFDQAEDIASIISIPKGMLATRREILEEYIEYAVSCQDNKVYGSNLCNIMKPLHNFFCGCPENGQQLYKRKLDDLLKIHTKSAKNNIIVTAGHPTTSAFESIVWKAVEGTIPDVYLDCDFRSQLQNNQIPHQQHQQQDLNEGAFSTQMPEEQCCDS